jgi:tetratricopeptide (TPR) repeat protein
MLHSSPEYRKFLPRFAQLLDQSAPAALAFEQAFGRPFEAALADLRSYVGKRQFAMAEVYSAREEAVEVESEALGQESADVARAELLVQLGRGEQAAKLLEAADGASPEVQTALGLRAMQDKDARRARDHFQRAIESGKASALTYFEYAMLLRGTGGAKEEVKRYLLEAVGRNPALAEAQFLVGLMAQQENRHREAIASFEKAVEVLPRQSYFWHALALSWHALGDDDRARRAARKAADSAPTAAQREMAVAAVRLAAAAPVTTARKKPEVTIPESWRPKSGDARLEGTLEHIDCLGASARMHVRAGGKPVALWIDKPGEVLLGSESGITFTFTCGAQRLRRVVIEYNAEPDPARKTEGLITRIEFR